MNAAIRRLGPDRIVGLAFVVLLHAAVLYGLLSQRMLPLPAALAPVFVDFITPPPAETPPPKAPERAQPVRLDKPRPVEPPRPQQLVAETPVIAPTDIVAPAPRHEPPPPIVAAAAAPAPQAAGPLTLNDELSLSCPTRTPPVYPSSARRRGDQGRVLLRVELDEQGSVTRASVSESSGFEQLDAAALAAVRQWQCQIPRRGGQPVRAVALQPFNFTLEGR